MTIEYRLGGSLLSQRVELTVSEDGYVAAAELGSLGTGGVTLDDPAGDLTFNGFSTFTVDDTDATPTRVWTGYIADRGIGRGSRVFTGTGRVYDCNLLDLNFLLKLVALRSNAAKRTAETDVARVAWLLTSEALTGLVTDEGLVSTLNATGFLAEDTRHSYALDVLTGVAGTGAKNFFVYRDETSGNAALFHDRDTAAVWPSSLSISNDPADVNGTTVFPPNGDLMAERSPDELYSGIDYIYKGNPIYLASATTEAALGFKRDLVYHTDRVGKLATAQSEAAAFLNAHAGERDVIPVTIRVPSASVNFVYAGQELNIKLVHVPGYSSYTATRVRRCSKIPSGPGFWDVVLELFVLGTQVSDAAPPEDPCEGTDDLNLLHGTDTAAGTNPPLTPEYANDDNATTSATASAFVSGNGTFTNLVVADLGTAYDVTSMHWYSADGTANYLNVIEHSADGAAWTPITTLTDDHGAANRTITFATLNKRYFRLGRSQTFPPGLYFVSGYRLTTWEIFGCAAAEDPLPFTDDPVNGDAGNPVPDGATDTFTTSTPYQGGTLTVYLDGINIVADVTESDPETGEFTLGFTPESDERLSTSYVAQ